MLHPYMVQTMYQVKRIRINRIRQNKLFKVLDNDSHLAKNLYNASLFRIRQNFTSRNKIVPTPLEREVLDEIEITSKVIDYKPGAVMDYKFLEKLMRVTNNPDFFNGLPMQTAQAVVRRAVDDFENWLKSLEAYRENPDAFLGKPRMPRYKKKDYTGFIFSNQDAVIYSKGLRKGKKIVEETHLKLPLTKVTVQLPDEFSELHLKQVEVKPSYGDYEILLVSETESDTVLINSETAASIDFGVDNIAAYLSTAEAILYKSGIVKSRNQWFNKMRSRYLSVLTRGKDSKHSTKSSRRLDGLSRRRENFLRDYFHKLSKMIVNQCLKDNVGVLVLGANKDWKQESDLGKANNQNFVQMPFALLRQMITYKAELAGVRVIEQEESYTSKADFLAGDYIPTYGIDDEGASFSGKRFKRGLYRAFDGTILNADLNGAANICRKALSRCNVPISVILNPKVVRSVA